MLIRPPRLGISLVELLIVLAVLGVAASALARIAVHQQQSFRLLATRSITVGQLREGSEILAVDLAGIDPAAGDIYDGEMHASSIAFRATIGTYLLCAPPSRSGAAIDVVPLGAAEGSQGTAKVSRADPPAAGDSLWLYDTGGAIDAADDVWRAHVVTATATIRVPCAVSGDSGDVAGTRLTLAPRPSPSVPRHAPVRLFRRVRYALYRSGNGSWQLGFSDCRPIIRSPACAPMQPVSGPYLPPAAVGAAVPGGLTLQYLARDGAPTDDPLLVAAIELTLRSGTTAEGTTSDALSTRRTVVLRNAGPRW